MGRKEGIETEGKERGATNWEGRRAPPIAISGYTTDAVWSIWKALLQSNWFQ